MPIITAVAVYKTFSGPVNILGNGPSLKKARLAHDAPCIGINRSWRIRGALFHCFVDQKQFSTLIEGKLHESHYIIIPPEFRPQFHKDWWRLFPEQAVVFYDCTAGFGGSYAIHAAKMLGFTTIYLHGFDGTNYLGNFVEPDPQASMRVAGQYPSLEWHAEHAAEDGVEIYNCTPGSDVPYFTY